MEYQKLINLLDNTTDQPFKFAIRNYVEINDESRVKYDSSCNKFKTSVVRSDSHGYSDAYILVSKTVTIKGAGDDGNTKRINKRNKGVMFKHFAPFTNCISSINNTEIDNVEYINVVMLIYNLIEYSNNYSKTSGSLW